MLTSPPGWGKTRIVQELYERLAADQPEPRYWPAAIDQADGAGMAGIMQGLMWRAYNEFGFLEYSFVETVEAMHPYYIIRAMGGGLYLLGALIMVYNLWRTATSNEPAHERLADAPAAAAVPAE